MANALVTIGIPAYKSLFLKDAILSIVNQSYSNWELVIVDDCSPNNIYSIVREFESDPRIKYHRNDHNIGGSDPVANWNKCLSYATGEFFCLLCDDDMYEPNCIETMLELAYKYPKCNVFRMKTRCIYENGSTFDYFPSCPEYESTIDYIWHFEKGWRLQAISEWMLRTDRMKKTGGYEPLPMAWGSDYLSIFKFAKSGGIASTTQISCINRKSKYQITLNCAKYAKSNVTARNLYEHKLQNLFGKDQYFINIVAPILKSSHDKFMTRELTWCSWKDWLYIFKHRKENKIDNACFRKSFFGRFLYIASKIKNKRDGSIY